MHSAQQQLDAAFAALNRGDFDTARAIASTALAREPQWAPMHFVAGVAALELNEPAVAVAHLQPAVDAQGAHAHARIHLARAYAMLQDFPAAADQIESALALAGEDPQVLDSAGVVLTACGQHERALHAFRGAAALAPRNPGIQYNLGTALTTHGDLDAAQHHLEACIELEPSHWHAHYALAHLRRQTRDSNHVARLEALRERLQGRVTASLYVGVALAKELEDLGDHQAAFARLTEAKSGPRRLLGYSPAKDRALMDALLDVPLPPADAPVGFESEKPVFIVGMPRTGTTLVDRILSSHPQVTQAGELHNFASVLKQAAGGPAFNLFDPASLRAARDLDWREIGERYVDSTRSLAGQTPRFTDKLPHNFLYAGLIAAALPNARIICVARNPLDTCLSNFRQLFAPQSPYFDYSYDLLHIGEYYIGFRRMMAHWRQAFPGRILEVDYESIVDEQETTTRTLLEFCGLPWDPACLSFEKNAAPVSTASATQVREPLYRSALGRWKHYEAELRPLRERLSAAGIDVGG